MQSLPAWHQPPVPWSSVNQFKALLPASGISPLTSLPQDTVGTVGVVLFHPEGSGDDVIALRINPVGQLFQPTVTGLQPVGNIAPNGNFSLLNGLKGNLFNNSYLKESGNLEQSENPFVKQLANTQRNRTVGGSEIPLIRKHLHSLGLTGQGIKVAVVDGVEPEQKQSSLPLAHAKAVAQTINDPVWGVSPGALVEQLGTPWQLENEFSDDSMQAFTNKITKDYLNLFGYMSDKLQAIMDKRDPALRVLNNTSGFSRSEKYQEVWAKLRQTNQEGYYKYPVLRQAILGETIQGSYTQQFQRMINLIDGVVESTPAIQQAYLRYVEMTRQAASRGIIFVAAAANGHDTLSDRLALKPGSELNEYTKSPYVIISAASNTNQTPGQYGDDRVTSFSSRGAGYFNPTVAAPGEEIGMSYPEAMIGHNLTTRGTSFSTPFTCGVIALMLQRNPFLTFDQVKAKLQNTAVKSPYYGPADYGAGFLNPVAAVLS